MTEGGGRVGQGEGGEDRERGRQREGNMATKATETEKARTWKTIRGQKWAEEEKG